ncbi:MAG: hypothetical protein J6M64_12735 [Oscillospiraceae bacterium]|nr:hypothetical protein [Oscillospiraceae bacterium]
MEKEIKRIPEIKAADEESMKNVIGGGAGADPSKGCPHCGSFQIVRTAGGFKCLDCGTEF